MPPPPAREPAPHRVKKPVVDAATERKFPGPLSVDHPFGYEQGSVSVAPATPEGCARRLETWTSPRNFQCNLTAYYPAPKEKAALLADQCKEHVAGPWLNTVGGGRSARGEKGWFLFEKGNVLVVFTVGKFVQKKEYYYDTHVPQYAQWKECGVSEDYVIAWHPDATVFAEADRFLASFNRSLP